MSKTWAPVQKPRMKDLQLQEYIVPVETTAVYGAAPGSSQNRISAPPKSPTKETVDVGDIIEGLISTKVTLTRARPTSKIVKILEPPHQKMHIAITQGERERQARQMKAILRSMKSFDPFERKIAQLDHDMHRCLTAVQQVVEIIHQNEGGISGAKQITLDKNDVKGLLLEFPEPYILEEDLSD